jgi:hypothetical protein
MATHVGGSILLQMLQAECETLGVPYRHVPGLHATSDDSLEVSSPSRQLEILRAMKTEPPKRRLLLGLCYGAFATTQMVEENSTTLKAVLVAPPLANPGEPIPHPYITKNKIRSEGGSGYIPVRYFSPEAPTDFAKATIEPALIPSDYFTEVKEHTWQLAERAERLARLDILRLVVPQQDWNRAAVELTTEWPGKIFRPDAAHMLHSPSDPNRTQQQMFASATLHLGLEMIAVA